MKKTLKDKIGDYHNHKNPIAEKTLLEDKDVTREMVRQWQSAPETLDEELVSHKREMWSGIAAYINMRRTELRLKFYRRFSAAAAVAIVVLGGCLAFLSDSRTETLHFLTTGNQDKQVVVLDDGTRVMLGPNSSLQYPEAFSGKSRRVSLEGQAFFDVASDASHPFTVAVCGVDITALGTSFEIFSPTDKRYVEAILQTGKICVDYPVGNTRQSNIILPNHKLTYDRQSQLTTIVTTDATKYSEWTSRFGQSFKNEQLRFVIPRLEKWYGVQIQLDSELYGREDRFTFKITDESLEHILGLMQKSSGVKWRKNETGDRYLLY